MAKKKEAVEIVVIMDRSGSMSSVRDEAIGGFNNFLANQQALPGAANLTVVQFDDQYEVPVDGKKFAKEFSARLENLEEVINKAIEYRHSRIKEINSLLGDSGYTERHLGGLV